MSWCYYGVAPSHYCVIHSFLTEVAIQYWKEIQRNSNSVSCYKGTSVCYPHSNVSFNHVLQVVTFNSNVLHIVPLSTDHYSVNTVVIELFRLTRADLNETASKKTRQSNHWHTTATQYDKITATALLEPLNK